jgi:hypothetical protein
MLPKIHAEITKRALSGSFSAAALEKIIQANLYQDRLTGQIGHDEFHFDNNAFEKSHAYIEEQRGLVVSSLRENNVPSAWCAFGRLTHTAQDFYAHSNYIDLWVAIQSNGAVPTPSEVDPLDEGLLHSRALRSGKLYYPLELFAFIKFLKPIIKPLLPRDSHAWMNLDSPKQGAKFVFAYKAAVKRTKIEFEKIAMYLANAQFVMFVDK